MSRAHRAASGGISLQNDPSRPMQLYPPKHDAGFGCSASYRGFEIILQITSAAGHEQS